MPDDREIVLGVSVPGADAAAAKFDKVGDSVTALDRDLNKLADGSVEDELGKLPEPIRLAFKRAEAAADEFQRKAEELSLTGPRDLRKVTVAQTLLNQEIQKAGLELDKLGPEAKAAFAKLEAAQKSAIITTSKLKADLDDVNVQTKTGVTGFTGFGNAAEAMGGKIGAAAEGMTFFTGALAAGIAAGQQFNRVIGTDMQAQETFFSLLAMRLKTGIEGIAEAFVAANESMVALAHGDWDELKRQSGELQTAFDKVTGAVTKTDSELYAQRDALKAAEEAAKQKALADAKLADAQKKAADEAKKLADEQKKLKDETDKVTASIAAQTAELDKQRGIAESSTSKGSAATKDLAVAKSNVTALGEEVETARAHLRDMIDAYGENSSAAINAAKDVAELESRFAAASAAAEKLAKDIETFAEAQKAAAEKAAASAKDLETLRQTQDQLNKKTKELSGETETFKQKVDFAGASTAQFARAQETLSGTSDNVATKLVTETRTLEDGTKAYSIRQVALTDAEIAERKAAAATDAHAESQTKAESAVTKATTAIGKLNQASVGTLQSQLDRLVATLDSIPQKVDTAAAAINKLGKSGDDGDDGITITRAGGGAIDKGSLTGGLGRPKGATGWGN